MTYNSNNTPSITNGKEKEGDKYLHSKATPLKAPKFKKPPKNWRPDPDKDPKGKLRSYFAAREALKNDKDAIGLLTTETLEL